MGKPSVNPYVPLVLNHPFEFHALTNKGDHVVLVHVWGPSVVALTVGKAT